MNKIKFGIIGCGYQTQKNMAPSMTNSNYAEIVGFYDIDIKKSQILADKYLVHQYLTLSELFKNESIDAIYIATPTSTHEELCILSADAGKHILCEKSLAMNVGQAENIVNKCKENNVFLMEGFMYQYHTQHQFVKEMILNNEIGEPITFNAWFGFPSFPKSDFRMNKAMGGGAILDAGAYVVHAARTFFGSEPIQTESFINYGENRLDIHGSVLMDFGEGRAAHLTFGMDNFYKNSYSVWGTKGELTLLRAFSIPEGLQPKCRLSKQSLVTEFTLPSCNHFEKELEVFYSSIKSNQFYFNEIINQATALAKLM